MTTDDAGQALGCSDAQVARLCRQGKLPGSERVRKSEVDGRWRWNVSGTAVRARKAELKRKASRK